MRDPERHKAALQPSLYPYSFVLATLLHELTHLSYEGHGKAQGSQPTPKNHHSGPSFTDLCYTFIQFITLFHLFPAVLEAFYRRLVLACVACGADASIRREAGPYEGSLRSAEGMFESQKLHRYLYCLLLYIYIHIYIYTYIYI